MSNRRFHPGGVEDNPWQKRNLCYNSFVMETKVLNYRIIIEPDTRIGTKESGYAAYCPTLGLADGGDTIEEAIANMKKLIEFHLECLVKEKQSIPTDKEDEIVVTTSVRVHVPQNISFA